MAGNSFGKEFRITTFGESHGIALGVIIDGVPPRVEISEEEIQKELDRRKPGTSEIVSPRKESDKAKIVSGVFEGKTTGTPLMIIIHNADADSGAYEKYKEIFRPGHADFTYSKKYGIRDHRGAGRSSGRETVGRVAAGAVAKKVLAKFGIKAQARIINVGGVECNGIDEKAEKIILEAKEHKDSVGGIIECKINGVPAGLGEPVFDKLEAELGKAILSIGAVKGIEFGTGFKAAFLNGSTNNDQMTKDGFLSNNAGGILGGISTGEEIIFRLAVKPTASIETEQQTIDVNGNNTKVVITGRHDPCICPRIVPVVEAMALIVILDMLLRHKIC